jgi:hypothetical protein
MMEKLEKLVEQLENDGYSKNQIIDFLRNVPTKTIRCVEDISVLSQFNIAKICKKISDASKRNNTDERGRKRIEKILSILNSHATIKDVYGDGRCGFYSVLLFLMINNLIDPNTEMDLVIPIIEDALTTRECCLKVLSDDVVEHNDILDSMDKFLIDYLYNFGINLNHIMVCIISDQDGTINYRNNTGIGCTLDRFTDVIIIHHTTGHYNLFDVAKCYREEILKIILGKV